MDRIAVPKLLIDADVLVYRAGFAAEKTNYLVTDLQKIVAQVATAADAKELVTEGRLLWSRKVPEPVEKAIQILDVMIADIRARYANMEMLLVLSGVGNFRTCIATRATYKGNRDGAAKPVHSKALRAHLEARGAVVSAFEEADDLLGIYATAEPGSVIASVDKDLLQIPGLHYDPVTKEETVVTPKQGAFNFYAQVLSGDPVDNVPGIKGIGPVKARKALEGCASPLACWEKCLQLYGGEFGAEKGPVYALEAARLVFIRKQVGEMWTPPVSTRILPGKKREAA